MRVWRDTVTLKGDYTRANADIVAMAASDGLITSRVGVGLYGSQWLITEAGLKRLNPPVEED
jgi:hypothetical protein